MKIATTISESTPRRWSPTHPTNSLSFNTGVAVLRSVPVPVNPVAVQSPATTSGAASTGFVREGTPVANGYNSRSGRNLFGIGSRLCGIARPTVINTLACNAQAQELATAGARCYQPHFASVSAQTYPPRVAKCNRGNPVRFGSGGKVLVELKRVGKRGLSYAQTDTSSGRNLFAGGKQDTLLRFNPESAKRTSPTTACNLFPAECQRRRDAAHIKPAAVIVTTTDLLSIRVSDGGELSTQRN